MHLLSGYHLEAGGDDRLELGAEPDLGIAGKIVRFHHADFFRCQAISALVGVQAHGRGGIRTANATVAHFQPLVAVERARIDQA